MHARHAASTPFWAGLGPLVGARRAKRATTEAPLLLEYAKLDAQEGSIDVDVIYRNRNDAQRLVLVPRLYGVRVMGGENKGAVAIWREMLVGLAAGYFERKRGTKAILYEQGKWSLIDWESGRLSAR